MPQPHGIAYLLRQWLPTLINTKGFLPVFARHHDAGHKSPKNGVDANKVSDPGRHESEQQTQDHHAAGWRPSVIARNPPHQPQHRPADDY